VDITSVREQLAEKFETKEYRDAFVAEQIFSRLPLKIRCLREGQELTQRQLGDLAGMAQTWVSKLEDPNYGKLTISTLLKLASAFDVGLEVDFVPFSTILDNSLHLSADSFVVPAFAHDAGFVVDYNVIAGTSNETNFAAPTMGTIVSSQSAVSVVVGDAPTPARSASGWMQQSVPAA
jgi:transcriptional regulator with XRE-family HTH domain